MSLSPKSAAGLGSLAILICCAMDGAPAAAQSAAEPDTAQVSLQATDVSFGGRLTFSGRGFAAGESAAVTVEDDQGGVQARLEPVKTETDGQVYMVSVPVPGGLSPGAHALRVSGQTSGRFGRASFNLSWRTPEVHLEAYTGKPTHTLSFSGSGFVPGESVDMFLGDQTLNPLASVVADDKGDISAQSVSIPVLAAGDYRASFVGRVSTTPVSIGFNIQGFHPWVVLHSYYVPPHSGLGFSGEDFFPGEVVQVYLNSLLALPVAQVTADGDGRFAVDQAFSLPDLTGDNDLIFFGQQSQTEVTTRFSVATP